jgi:hypothetical protein
MLLDYALLTAPTPLQAGSPATLTLVISNGGRQPVTVTSIGIALPVGTNAKDLTAGTGFQSAASAGWNLAQNGGALTLTPASGTGPIGANAVVVTIANVAINNQPGTAQIVIDETAALAGGSPANTSMSLPAAKFPAQFSLSDLVATPPEVAFGGSSSLMWTGTQVEGAKYTLQYPGSGLINVTNVGPYPATNLTIFPAVFTLTVSIAVPGEDQPLIVQKQATVAQAPELRILDFSQSKMQLAGGDDKLVLTWEVQLATWLKLGLKGLSGTVDVTGLSGCTVSAPGAPPLLVADASGHQRGTLPPPAPFPSFLTLELSAGDGSSVKQASVDVEVLPPQIGKFTSSWDVVDRPTAYFEWQTANASPVTIVPDLGISGGTPPSGWAMINGQWGHIDTTTYTLTALGFGSVLTAKTTIWG